MTVSTGKHPAFPVDHFYTQKVVLLINERTQSRPEFAVMCLRNDPKVTVIGSNSVGADGDVAYIPLPGDLFLCFTAHGIYHPDGGQTQRVGLSPDIEVYPTIQGIREGRDELMEAAVQYLKDNK